MQIITGDETGLLKIIDLARKTVVKTGGEVGKLKKVLSINQYTCQEIRLICILTKNRLQVIDDSLNELASIELNFIAFKMFIQDQELIIIDTCCVIWKARYDLNLNEITINIQSEVLKINESVKNPVILRNANIRDHELLFVFKNKPPVIYNLKNSKINWQAKNVKNDELDLQVKIEDFCGVFLDDHTIAVTTVHKTVRIYNLSQPNSRPIYEYPIKETLHPLQFIVPYQNKIYISNMKGEVLVYNQSYQIIGKLKGTQGSIRDLVTYSNYIITISLDRFLRIYSAENSALLQDLNLGQRLSAISFLTVSDIEIEKEEKEEQIWTIKNGKEAKARFAGMRKHSIRLPYLKKMFENQKVIKDKQKKQQELEKVRQQIEQDRNQNNQEYYLSQKLKNKTISKQSRTIKKSEHRTNKPLKRK